MSEELVKALTIAIVGLAIIFFLLGVTIKHTRYPWWFKIAPWLIIGALFVFLGMIT